MFLFHRPWYSCRISGGGGAGASPASRVIVNKGTRSRTDRAASCRARLRVWQWCVCCFSEHGVVSCLHESLACTCFVLFYLDMPLHRRVNVPLGGTSWICLGEVEFSKSSTCPYASTVIRWNSLNINFRSVKFPCLFIL